MRFFCVTVVALLVLAGSVQAQVAAPSLDPNGMSTFGPINPATQVYSGSSRVGVTIGDLLVESTTGGVKSTFAESDGGFIGQVLFVGESFSIGAESATIDLLVPSQPTASATFGGTYVGAAFRIGEMLSLGVGKQTVTFETDSGAGLSQSEEEALTILGATLRFGETFFLGLGTGTESVTTTQTGSPDSKGDRRVTRIGVGFLSRKDDSGFHLEVFKEIKDGINDTATGLVWDEEDSSGVVLEAVFSNFLLGAQKISGEEKNGATGTASKEVDSTGITIGWAPMKGLSISVSRLVEDTTTISTGDIETLTFSTVGVSWLF